MSILDQDISTMPNQRIGTERNLSVSTPHGVFTRTSARSYTHVAVRETGDGRVHATWHLTEAAARKPRWSGQVILGVYPVP